MFKLIHVLLFSFLLFSAAAQDASMHKLKVQTDRSYEHLGESSAQNTILVSYFVDNIKYRYYFDEYASDNTLIGSHYFTNGYFDKGKQIFLQDIFTVKNKIYFICYKNKFNKIAQFTIYRVDGFETFTQVHFFEYDFRFGVNSSKVQKSQNEDYVSIVFGGREMVNFDGDLKITQSFEIFKEELSINMSEMYINNSGMYCGLALLRKEERNGLSSVMRNYPLIVMGNLTSQDFREIELKGLDEGSFSIESFHFHKLNEDEVALIIVTGLTYANFNDKLLFNKLNFKTKSCTASKVSSLAEFGIENPEMALTSKYARPLTPQFIETTNSGSLLMGLVNFDKDRKHFYYILEVDSEGTIVFSKKLYDDIDGGVVPNVETLSHNGKVYLGLQMNNIENLSEWAKTGFNIPKTNAKKDDMTFLFAEYITGGKTSSPEQNLSDFKVVGITTFTFAHDGIRSGHDIFLIGEEIDKKTQWIYWFD
jgi:hypothetical protein